MTEKIEDRNVEGIVPLISPRAVKAQQPLTARAAEVVLETRRAICDVLHGRDRDRLLVVVGPCSIHDPDAALDYARRLARIAEATRDRLIIVMRTFFEKPRTTVGWKGLINDPHLDGSCEIATGLQLARKILLEINELGLPCGGEVLDPITPQYISDLLSWASIGARTIESQTHREMASGLSMPIGFKNSTEGGLEVALHAMISARHPHTFLGITADGTTATIKTVGNPDRHVVLRGGGGRPNYSPADVTRAAEMVASEGLARPVMIDCSHGNSQKDHTRQPQVCREVLAQLDGTRGTVMGLLIESNLEAGRQDWSAGTPLRYGVSLTDACIGWGDTETLLGEIAAAAHTRSAA